MNKIEESVKELIDSINALPQIKRLHELEVVLDKNEEIKSQLSRLKEVQKNMVNARYYSLPNQAELDALEIKKIKESISNTPLLEEYIDLLNEAYMMLSNISKIIEDVLNNSI